MKGNKDRCIAWVRKNGPVCISTVALEFGWAQWRASQILRDAAHDGILRMINQGGVTTFAAPIATTVTRSRTEGVRKKFVMPKKIVNSVFQLGEIKPNAFGSALKAGFAASGQLRETAT